MWLPPTFRSHCPNGGGHGWWTLKWPSAAKSYYWRCCTPSTDCHQTPPHCCPRNVTGCYPAGQWERGVVLIYLLRFCLTDRFQIPKVGTLFHQKMLKWERITHFIFTATATFEGICYFCSFSQNHMHCILVVPDRNCSTCIYRATIYMVVNLVLFVNLL